MQSPWAYIGPFRIEMKEASRVMSAPPGTMTYMRVLNGSEVERIVYVIGRLRLNRAGPEYLSGIKKGIPFYWAPRFIRAVIAKCGFLLWHERIPSAGRACPLCGGSGWRLRPTKRKLLNFVSCTMCEETGIAKREMITLDELLETMRLAGRAYGRRAREQA